MNDIISIVILILSVYVTVASVLLLRRKGEPADLSAISPRFEALEAANAALLAALREEALRDRTEAGDAAMRLRGEVSSSSLAIQQGVTSLLAELGGRQQSSLDRFAEQFHAFGQNAQEQARGTRDEVSRVLKGVGEATAAQIKAGGELQQQSLSGFADRLDGMVRASELAGRQLREEITGTLTTLGNGLSNQAKHDAEQQRAGLEGFSKRLDALATTLDGRMGALTEGTARALAGIRDEGRLAAAETRREFMNSLNGFQEAIKSQLANNATNLQTQLGQITDSTEKRLEAMRATVDQRLNHLQGDNAAKLESIRQTVEEKLQGTLERRLGESFRLVSERLEQVQRGLGDMQSLASGVGDLKKVLTNVKTRGTWGECQLGALLEQMLTPDQFACNVATVPDSTQRVEFAVRLPGRDGDQSKPVWLPIDAKCPVEDYQRLVEAADRGDADAVREHAAKLEVRIRACAKDIASKYIAAPHTTDFAIMFIPTEGLYAELLRMPGLHERLQHEHRVLIAGPTNLAAILNTLQMGFRALAIQQRSGEVWGILAGVKTEFGKFGGVLDKVKKQIAAAGNTIDAASRRTRAMERQLRGVEALPAGATPLALDLTEAIDPIEEAVATTEDAA